MLGRLTGALVLALALTGCKGDAGPMGPQGPPGPQGEQGPPGTANMAMLTGTIDAEGLAIRALPAESGSMTDLPAVVCYLKPPDLQGWFLVTDGFAEDAPFCTLGMVQGVFSAVMFQAPPGWTYAFVVFW